MTTVRVALPSHLRTLAGVGGEVRVDVRDPPSLSGVLDALELRFPMLKGTIRDHGADRRRDFMRIFADGDDLSDEPLSTPLPAPVASGDAVLQIVGAIAGG